MRFQAGLPASLLDSELVQSVPMTEKVQLDHLSADLLLVVILDVLPLAFGVKVRSPCFDFKILRSHLH